ncbi:MAG: Mrp/NBP35 family ATP-binding protein [Candidatus Latescibacteria bacterium]|jgi:ATP-binding protein involved in chromosome partitioning|nr:Mrp/NBP35 family ATP-binding protein [Candidatus Latescibacterota bacterium]
MAAISEQDVMDVLKQVKYPGFDRDIVSFGLVKNVDVEGSTVSFVLGFSTQDEPTRQSITVAAREAVSRLPDVEDVQILGPPPGAASGAQQPMGAAQGKIELPGVKSIVAVASGKGGVGKSTTSVNLAVALAESGASVGLLDADIYGPSIPTMMGSKDQPGVIGQQLIPLISHDIKMMSFGFLIPEDQSVTWRGPMVHQAVQQLLRDVMWGELDCLIIDMPPGTGDAHLTLTQSVALTGGVVVTTPQDVALIDARRGVAMFQQVNVPILGMVENMSHFICPHCNERTDIFTTGGGKRAAEALGVPFLGEIPIDPSICLAGDKGIPIVKQEPDSPQTQAFRMLAEKLKDSL